jgi:predicted nuclease with TOPRIM domain
VINLDLPLIATAIGIISVLWKFSSSINQFSYSVNDLKEAMKESKEDRKDLRVILNRHDYELKEIKTHYKYIRTDLDKINNKIDKKVG